MDDNPLKRHFVDFALSCVTIAIITSFFLVPDFRTSKFWLGDKGWLEILTLLGTTLAAAAAAWFAWKNYLQGQQKDIADRFERGVVLLESGSGAKRIAGIIVLEDLALLDLNGRHAKWIGEFLPAAINEWNTDTAGGLGSSGASPQTTPTHTLRAIRALSLTRTSPSPSREYLRNFHLVNAGLDQLYLPNVVASQAVFSEATIYASDFHQSVLAGRFERSVDLIESRFTEGRIAVSKGSHADLTFEGCDLSGTRITAQQGVEVTISGCKVDKTTVSGNGEIRFEKCWFDAEPPVLRNAFAIGGRLGIYKSDGRERKGKGLVPLWSPNSDDTEVSKALVASSQWLRIGEREERRRRSEDVED